MQTGTSKAHTGRTAYHAGLAAEDIVARTYLECGYQVVAQRWRGSVGEVDLILRGGDVLVFAEVKKSATFARAAMRITPKQKQRIFAAASEFVTQEPKGSLTDMRFDVALVNGIGDVDIVENALGDD